MDFILNGKDQENRSGSIALVTKIWYWNPSKLTIIGLFLFFDNYFQIFNEFLAKK